MRKGDYIFITPNSMKGFQAPYLDGCLKVRIPQKPFCSWFSIIFENILDELSPYYWAYSNDPLTDHARTQEEVEYFENIVWEPLPDICEPYTFFPKFARWISDDSISLWGFSSKPDPDIANEFELRGENIENILAYTDIFFHNIDAAVWECYMKDAGLLQKSLNSVKRVVKEQRIRMLDIIER